SRRHRRDPDRCLPLRQHEASRLAMRTLNRLLGLVLSLALIAGGVIALVEIVASAGDAHDVIVSYQRWWRSVLAGSWNTGWVTVAGLLCCAAGALLLALQLTRRHRRELALRER